MSKPQHYKVVEICEPYLGEYDFTQDTEQLALLFDLEKILALVIS